MAFLKSKYSKSTLHNETSLIIDKVIFTPNLQPDLSGNPFLRRLNFY